MAWTYFFSDAADAADSLSTAAVSGREAYDAIQAPATAAQPTPPAPPQYNNPPAQPGPTLTNGTSKMAWYVGGGIGVLLLVTLLVLAFRKK